MPRRLSLRRRLSTAARWPVGVGLTSWHYLWRTVPLHRTEQEGDPHADCPPALPGAMELDDVQHHDVGFGPLFHRRYRTRIREAKLTADELIERVAADPNCASPTEFASFIKLHGESGQMRVGDEYRVRMAGPWDGPVRVVDRTSRSFSLATLDGHLEAGQIRFSAEPQNGMVVFEIESWARSSGRVVHLLYDRLRIAKEVQLHMWTSMLQRIAEVAGGRVTGGIDIETRRVPQSAAAGVAKRLAALRNLPVNYDPEAPHPESDGWRIDDFCEVLPSEPPGPPIDGGPFQIAQTLLRDYKVADPSIVRAHYDRDAPLEGRDMLLELRFLVFRTFGGCRVGRITDERRTVERPAGAGLGLALPDARGPHRAGRDVLGGLEVARHRRGPVPRSLLLADGGLQEPVHARRGLAVRSAAATPVPDLGLPAHAHADDRRAARRASGRRRSSRRLGVPHGVGHERDADARGNEAHERRRLRRLESCARAEAVGVVGLRRRRARRSESATGTSRRLVAQVLERADGGRGQTMVTRSIATSDSRRRSVAATTLAAAARRMLVGFLVIRAGAAALRARPSVTGMTMSANTL